MTAHNPVNSEVQDAMNLLRRTGTRLMRLPSTAAVGVWSDQDGPELRRALRALELDRLPFRYLDGDSVPAWYKLRRIPGQPVSLSVLRIMERDPKSGWRIRDEQSKGATR